MKWVKISLLCVIVGITYLSLKAPDGGVEIKVNDKIGHTIAYLVLTLNVGLLLSKKNLVLAGLIAFSYSCLMEYLQGYVPGRSVDWKDLIANGSGAVVGVLLLLFFRKQLLQLLQTLKLISPHKEEK